MQQLRHGIQIYQIPLRVPRNRSWPLPCLTTPVLHKRITADQEFSSLPPRRTCQHSGCILRFPNISHAESNANTNPEGVRPKIRQIVVRWHWFEPDHSLRTAASRTSAQELCLHRFCHKTDSSGFQYHQPNRSRRIAVGVSSQLSTTIQFRHGHPLKNSAGSSAEGTAMSVTSHLPSGGPSTRSTSKPSTRIAFLAFVCCNASES